MNSVDIYFFLKENNLNDARIEKIYHENGEVILRLYKGKKFILKISKKYIMLTDKFSSDSNPDTFTMTMRKYLKGKITIEQHNLDRVLEIKTSNGILICEMFRNGNFIICDNNYKIILPEKSQEWRTRKIKSKEIYKYPPSRNIFNRENFIKEMKSSDKKIVSFIGSSGFGVYSEEICLMANVDKETQCKNLSDEKIEKIYDLIKTFLKREIKPNIIFKEDKIYDFSPVNLKIYDNYKKNFYPNFNNVLNIVFKPVEKKKEDKVENIIKDKSEKYEKMEKEFLDTALFIQENADYIQFFLNSMKNKIKGMKKVKIDINGKKITIDLSKSLMKNASIYYERAKQVKNKIEKIKSLIERNDKKKEKHISKDKIKDKELKVEKFREFKTSDGFLVIAGKNADTNEFLIKKRIEKNDIVFHADIVGAPFTVIKTNGKRPSAKAIKEAAQFAACYSKAWKQGLGTINVYWIRPNQIKKVPGLPKGSFQIQGKRNYLRNVELKLYFEPIKGRIELLPFKSSNEKFLELVPGNMKSNNIMNEIKKKFKGYNIPSELEGKIPYGMGELIKK